MERAAKSQADQEPGRPAAARFSHTSSAGTVIDNRPVASAQRMLADAINDSPRVAAQRKQLGGMFGSAIQPVQRYRAIKAAGYQAQPDVNEKEQKPFTHQDPTAALRDVGDPLVQYPRYSFIEKPVEARPDLLVADDDTVAVQREPEPKEFYATAGVVEHANTALIKAGSKFVLKPKGHQLTVGKQTLSIVSPVLREPEVGAGGGLFGRYFTSVCRDFTAKVIGSSSAAHKAIFQTATGPGEADPKAAMHRRKIDTSGSTGSTAVRNVAASLSEPSGAAALDKAFERDPVAEEDTATGIAYGTSARKGELLEKARGLGINEFAAPGVGEGYATYTNNADTDVGQHVLDYAAAHGPIPRANIWGYHFAGVVAQSADGHDRITLENYNRGDDIDALLKEVIRRLLQGHQLVVQAALERVQREWESAQGIGAAPTTSLLNAAYKAAYLEAYQSTGEKAQDANNAYSALMDARNDSQAWFFQIYGSLQGQTFHERQAASGFFANPLTLRVGKVSEEVAHLQATLVARLNNVPGLVLGLQDHVAYAPMLQSGIRQVQARTTAQEAQAACKQVLTQLVRLRLLILVERAARLAAAEGVKEGGDVFGSIDPLITGVERKREALAFYQLIEGPRLDGVLTELRTLRTAAQALTAY